MTPTGNGPILAEPRLSFATINHATPNSVGGSSVDFFNLEGNERTPHEDYSSSISVVVGGENAQQESDGAEQRLLVSPKIYFYFFVVSSQPVEHFDFFPFRVIEARNEVVFFLFTIVL